TLSLQRRRRTYSRTGFGESSTSWPSARSLPMLRKLVGALVGLAVLTGGLWAAADKAADKDKVTKDKVADKDDCRTEGVITHAPKGVVKVPEGHHLYVVTDAKGVKHHV